MDLDNLQIKKYSAKVDKKTGDLILSVKTPYGMFSIRQAKEDIVNQIKQTLETNAFR